MMARETGSGPAVNPVLVEVLRGDVVESRHRGAVAVVDADGQPVLTLGDTATPVYPRSAIKILQALPLVESGAADAWGFTDAELALACASHNGEPRHAATAAAMLAKLGLDADDLGCGTHWPTRKASSAALNRAGEKPSALHNNCSGKHAGMLAVAKQLGLPLAGYTETSHPVQQLARDAIGALTGVDMEAAPCGRDGCSVPTWALPLPALALGFARVAAAAAGQPAGLPPARAAACARLFRAATANPFMVAGTGRYCTAVMQLAPGRVFVKLGAEGVYCGAVPERGWGIAVKCDDGAERGASAIMTALLQKTGLVAPGQYAEIPGMDLTLKNLNGYRVGEIRFAPALAGAGLPPARVG